MEVPLYSSNGSQNNLLSAFITLEFVASPHPCHVHFEDFIDFAMKLRRTKLYYFDYITLAYETLRFYLLSMT